MASDEFDIIRRYFNSSALAFDVPELSLGIGDDCALLDIAAGTQLAVSMDMLQEGVHFLAGADPYLLGKRTLLVNLSDLAAMGARPVCFTLALSLPALDHDWLQAFSAGLAEVAHAHACALVGGDITASHPKHSIKTFCVQVHGALPQGEALLRSAARPGQGVYVTGSLGDAAAGLDVLREASGRPLSAQSRAALIEAFYVPQSRVLAGQVLRGMASACIDLSDGLASDLQHILLASGVGAQIELTALPMSTAFCEAVTESQRVHLALSGGDDYELCFTMDPLYEEQMQQELARLGVPVSCIGEIVDGEGIQCLQQGRVVDVKASGYKHFSTERSVAQEAV